MSEAKTCFVIMPFGEKPNSGGEVIDFDTIYTYLIKDVIEKRLKLKSIRSDEIFSAGWVHRDMLEQIVRADVVIADITTLNPNVFYELGVRHALRSSVTILIRKKGTELPFDIRGLRIIEYETDIKNAKKAQVDIENFVRHGLEQQRSDSLVFDIFPNLKVSF